MYGSVYRVSRFVIELLAPTSLCVRESNRERACVCRVCMCVCVYRNGVLESDVVVENHYGVATTSRLLKMTGLFCKRAL